MSRDRQRTLAHEEYPLFWHSHHGPGSARRLVAALERLNPALVLIEGPADCSELVPFLASDEMKPPVALLSFVTDETGHSLYYPFAEYSPEYQACLWALNTNTEVRFIDLPVSVQLASSCRILSLSRKVTTIQRQRLTIQIQIQPLFLKIPPRLTRGGSVRILSQHWPCLPVMRTVKVGGII